MDLKSARKRLADGVQRTSEVVGRGIDRVSGKEAARNIEEYCQRYTQVLVGMDHELQGERAANGRFREEVDGKVASLEAMMQDAVEEIQQQAIQVREAIGAVDGAISRAQGLAQRLEQELRRAGRLCQDVAAERRRLVGTRMLAWLSVGLALTALCAGLAFGVLR